jgi:hypothetical protein
MGYYSEVALVIKNDVEIPEDVSKSKYWTEWPEITVGKNYTLIHWQSTKCVYNPAIDSIIEMMKCLDSKSYHFFRVGEELGDYEMYGEATWADADCEFEIYPVQKLEISMPVQE